MVLTLLDRVVEARRGRAVVVRGDPGIGKSMLLEALAQAARVDGIEVRAVQTLDFGQAGRDRPSPALAAQLLGIPIDADDVQRRLAIARAVAAGTLPPGDELPALDLLGVSPSAEAASLLATMGNALRERNRARVLHGLVAHAAALRPQVIVVEDVHWADSGEIGQLGDLAAAIATLPVLLALSTRSDDDPISAAWRARARGCPVTMLDLAPLADDEARELAACFADLPVEIVERCLETAAGHPLFLEQLLRTARAGQTTLPGSVRALLLARVERLQGEMQRVLHAAATLGVRFSTAALRHVLGDPELDCSGLEAAGLLVHEGEECRFAHALIRTAIYESLLRSTRRELHRHAAGWYESRDCGLYAEHLTAADDPMASAAQLRAATMEQRAHRLGRALVHAERALELARDGHERFGARALLGDVYLAKGRTEDAIAAFRGSIDMAATRDERVRALIGLATGLRVLDRYDDALAALDQAEQGAVDGAEPQRLAQLWTLRGNLHFPRGELDACLHAHQRALEFAERARSPEDVARALGGLGDAQYQRGRMRTAHGHFQHCIALCDEHGIAGLRLAYLPMLAVTHYYLADFSTARAICDQVAVSAARAGDLRAELLAHSSQASITYYRAEYAASVDFSARSLARARELGARRFEAEASVQHGLALSGLGRREEALSVLEGAVALSRVAAPTYCGPWALAALASVCEDEAISRALLAEGESLLARDSVSHNHLEYRMHAIDVSLRFDDPAAALHHAAALEEYTREEPLPWAELVVARARALVRARESGLDAGTVGVLREALEAIQRIGFHSQADALTATLQSWHGGYP
jgi:tetratricopeptide (TPR) repeat protein